MVVIIVLVALVILILAVIYSYNSLVRARVRTEEAWSDIDVQLKRRYDLIPNLVETVKGYAAHEKELFENVTKARANAISAGTVQEQGQAENMLTSALRSIFAVAENYPELKASQNFQKLQDELTDTEDKIQAARRFYNTNARDYNAAIQTFPGNLMAAMFGFKPKDFFELEEPEERKAVKINF